MAWGYLAAPPFQYPIYISDIQVRSLDDIRKFTAQTNCQWMDDKMPINLKHYGPSTSIRDLGDKSYESCHDTGGQ
jgi:hypothetical protein